MRSLCIGANQWFRFPLVIFFPETINDHFLDDNSHRPAAGKICSREKKKKMRFDDQFVGMKLRSMFYNVVGSYSVQQAWESQNN